MSLAEAQAAFPAPEPGHVSPNSLYSAPLDLTPTTVIRNASLEAGSLPVAEEAATRRKKWEAQRRRGGGHRCLLSKLTKRQVFLSWHQLPSMFDSWGLPH